MSNIQLVSNLLRLRKTHNYTQQQVSDMLNISRQAYSLIRLSQIYHISLDELVNHSFRQDGILQEQKGPYTTALEISSADTIYLTQEEVTLIRQYRDASDDDRRLVKKVLNVTDSL